MCIMTYTGQGDVLRQGKHKAVSLEMGPDLNESLCCLSTLEDMG